MSQCFYDDFLRQPTKVSIPPRPRQKQISIALSEEEVRRIIYSCSNLKHRTLLLTVYSAGLRVSEAVKLEPVHIERSRKMIRVEQGKGRKDRYTLMKPFPELSVFWIRFRNEIRMLR
ncbi:tyrosine-type recombinase/integrase [uncultured Desulfobacter sp.]|uniref:tyrosine-type recombinase/integrase n=1 Tax=uncultured Desulfobacter sp. TaxID=240139 RepID=UPI0037485A0E